MANVVGLLGALLIFFNWIWGSAVTEDRNEALADLRSARQENARISEFRFIYGGFSSVDAALVRVERDLLEIAELIEPEIKDENLKLNNYLLRQQSRRYNWLAGKQINARQIDAGLAHCLDSARMSDADAISSPAGKLLRQVCSDMIALRDQKNALFDEISSVFDTDGDNVVDKIESVEEDEVIEAKVRELVDRYSDELLPKFGPLIERFVQVSRVREKELVTRLDNATRDAEFADVVGTWLYVLGSSMVIMRTILKDVVSAPQPKRRKRRSGCSAALCNYRLRQWQLLLASKSGAPPRRHRASSQNVRCKPD